jgi:hypothetical protein
VILKSELKPLVADPFSITVSVLALFISAVTAWLTLFRRGTVKMTQPTVIFFGPDHPRSGEILPKIFLRACSSQRQSVVALSKACMLHSHEARRIRISIFGCMGMKNSCEAVDCLQAKLVSS